MNHTIQQRRKALARALLSGDYQQGRNQLCFQGRLWCALGVACDIYSKSLLEAPQWEIDSEGEWSYAKDKLSAPKEVRQFFGMPDSEYRAIQEMNDVLLYSFKDIANYVEGRLHEAAG